MADDRNPIIFDIWKKMIRLREKEIEKLSIILQLPQHNLEKVASMGLINEPVAIDMLVVYDWKKLKRDGKYTVKQIIQALMDEYQISRSKVQSAVYGKRKHTYSCQKCGKRITKSESVRNNGICDMCVSKSIQL